MTSGNGDAAFLDRLGAHLERAATEGVPRSRRPLAVVALVTLVAIGTAGVLLLSRQSPAEAMVVTVAGQDVQVELRSPILDPLLPVRELDAVGVTARVVEVPVPDELIGRITAVSSLAGDADVRFDGPMVVFFSVDVGDELVIEIGREATRDESFVGTDSDSVCARWRNRPTDDVLGDIEASIDTVRWQLFDGTVLSEIEVPPPESFVQDVIPIDSSTSIVVLALSPDALPESPSCKPEP